MIWKAKTSSYSDIITALDNLDFYQVNASYQVIDGTNAGRSSRRLVSLPDISRPLECTNYFKIQDRCNPLQDALIRKLFILNAL